MEKQQLYMVRSSKGYLKGDGTAHFLKWAKTPRAGGTYLTLKGAEKAIDRLKGRDYGSVDDGEVVIVELIVHGTEDEIIERDLL